MTEVYLSLGANLGDRLQTLAQAVRHLEAGGVAVKTCSSVYETAPLHVLEQPAYLNLVLHGETHLKAEELMALALDTEQALGRERRQRWGPRTIDIDVLLYGDLVLDTPALTLPHPRLGERAFVLVPLLEVAPDLHLPPDGRPVAPLLEGLADQGIALHTAAASFLRLARGVE